MVAQCSLRLSCGPHQILKLGNDQRDLHVQELKGEMELMQSFNHPNIAKYYGG